MAKSKWEFCRCIFCPFSKISNSYETLLGSAVIEGDIKKVKVLLEKCVDLNTENEEGYTPLMLSCLAGDLEMTKLLISKGADINFQSSETSETPLELACFAGNFDIAYKLTKCGANIENGSVSPLMAAIEAGHLELTRLLVNLGANVNRTSEDEESPLTYACEKGLCNIAEILLEAKADMNFEANGFNPLMKAVKGGNLSTVQFLLSKGSNPKQKSRKSNLSSIDVAIAYNQEDCLAMLNNSLQYSEEVEEEKILEVCNIQPDQQLSVSFDVTKLNEYSYEELSSFFVTEKLHYRKAVLNLKGIRSHLGNCKERLYIKELELKNLIDIYGSSTNDTVKGLMKSLKDYINSLKKIIKATKSSSEAQRLYCKVHRGIKNEMAQRLYQMRRLDVDNPQDINTNSETAPLLDSPLLNEDFQGVEETMSGK